MPAQDSWRMTAGSLAISNYYFRKDLWMFPPVRELQKLSLNYQTLTRRDELTALDAERSVEKLLLTLQGLTAQGRLLRQKIPLPCG